MAQIPKFEFFSSLSHNVAIADTYFTGDAVKTTTSRSQMRLNSIGFVYPLETRRVACSRFRLQSSTKISITKQQFRALTPVLVPISADLLLTKAI